MFPNQFNSLDNMSATGFVFCEVSQVYHELVTNGWEVDFLSAKGGYCPVEPRTLKSKAMTCIDWKYFGDHEFRNKIAASKSPSEVNSQDYKVIHFSGGYGNYTDYGN